MLGFFKKKTFAIGAAALLLFISLPAIVNGVACLPTQGCTGTAAVPLAGQILIGNASGTYTVNYITPGSNINVATSSGGITISSTASGGITQLNGLTTSSQSFASSTTGTDFSITSSGNTHTFNLPTASASNRGLLSSSDWTTFNNKGSGTITGNGTSTQLAFFVGPQILSSSAGLTINTSTNNITLTGKLFASDGTQAAPSIAFSSQTGTGFSYGATGYTIASSNGVGIFYINNTHGVNFASNQVLGWGNNTNPYLANPDIAFGRNAAGVMEVNNGTLGAFADLKAQNFTATGVLTLPAGSSGTSSINFGTANTGFYAGAAGFVNGTANATRVFDFGSSTFSLRNGVGVTFDGTTAGVDAGIQRDAVGVLEINNGTLGTFRDLKLRGLTANGTSTFAAGAAANPGITIGAEQSGLWYAGSTGYMNLSVRGVNKVVFSNATAPGVWVGSTSMYAMANTADPYSGTGWNALAYNGAGVTELNNGTFGQWTALKLGTRDAITTSTTNGLTIGHQTTGVAATGFGTAILFNGDSSSTPDRNMASIYSAWSNAVDSTRTADIVFSTVNSAAALAEKMRITGAGKVGIGTSTPNSQLTVVGTIESTSGGIKFPDGTTQTTAASAGSGLTSLNGLITPTQTFATSTAGTDFDITSSGSVHTFSIPTASASNRGLLSSADWTTFNNKGNGTITGSGASTQLSFFTGSQAISSISGLTVNTSTASIAATGNGSFGTLSVGTTTVPGVGLFVNGGSISTLQNAILSTATLPNSSASETGNQFTITSGGTSSTQQTGVGVTLNAGYTGSGTTASLSFGNTVAGTGNNYFNEAANVGVGGITNGNTATGNNVGGWFNARSGLNNVGVFGRAIVATNATLNIGVFGTAINATNNVGGYFGLNSAIPTIAASAALMADNGAIAAPILVIRDNGTEMARFADGGNLAIGTTTAATSIQVANTSSTIRIGTGGINPGCFESYDVVNSSTLMYSYSTSGVWTTTSTKPTFCQ